MICDGILPSNEGRGYVLRRLLRRAARHGKLLGVDRPFLYEVVDTVVRENECQYPELREKQAYITRVIRTEEENFAKTLDGGMKIFSDMLEEHKAKGEHVFSGSDAFKLYDTYGFPIDLTNEMAAEQGLTVDEAAFKQLMQEQKERAREARKALGDLGWAGVEFGKEMPATEFDGYEKSVTEGKILAIVADEEMRTEIVDGVDALIVLDRTSMYAEMGGQVGDHGYIESENGKFVVTDVQKNKGGKFLHYGRVVSGEMRVGDVCSVRIDLERRKAVSRAHTATHLLQSALEAVLGDHVHQAGSLVEPDRLRFDFTHFEAVKPEELARVSRMMSEFILDGYPVVTEELPVEEAKSAARRRCSAKIRRCCPRGHDGRCRKTVSMELCGGTHLDNTAKVGPFRIVSEASVASGVRRIEAVTGKACLELTDEMNQRLVRVAEALKTTPAELFAKAEASMREIRDLHQTIEKMKDRLFAGEVDQFLFSAKNIGGLRVITANRGAVDAADLRRMGDFLRDKASSVVAVLSAVNGDKATLLAVCGKDAVAKGVKAGDIIKSIAPIIGGKGGGKPDSAMGGGSDLLKVDDALAAVDDYVASKVQ